MGLKLNTASSGSVTIEPTNTASNYTLTVPATNATLAINGPVFNATMSANQTISSATSTKVAFNVAPSFGSASNGWDTANNRFQPTVAGYYLITGCVYATGTGWADQSLIWITKNGSNELRCQDAGAKSYNLIINGMVYLNGTTDYLEIYAYSSSGKTIDSGASLTWVRGCLVRAA